MEFDEVVRTRRSVHEFTGEEIPRKKIEEAVEVARSAPSAWNLQPWKLFVLDSQEKVDQAVETTYRQDWIGDADKVLLVCGDTDFQIKEGVLEDFVKKGYKSSEEIAEDKELLESWSEKPFRWKELELTSNCMFFASALIHSLWNLGVASCPVKGFDQSKLQDNLVLEKWYPVLMIPVGISEEKKPKKDRREVEDLLDFF